MAAVPAASGQRPPSAVRRLRGGVAVTLYLGSRHMCHAFGPRCVTTSPVTSNPCRRLNVRFFSLDDSRYAGSFRASHRSSIGPGLGGRILYNFPRDLPFFAAGFAVLVAMIH